MNEMALQVLLRRCFTMANIQDRSGEARTEIRPARAETVALENKPAPSPAHTDESSADQLPAAPPMPATDRQAAPSWRKWVLLGGAVVGLGGLGFFLVPWVVTMLTTVSTDDAYVNGHVTFVAPRVAGQVSAVLVDDNMRVKKGDLLVQLDKEPFEVQVNIAEAAVTAARAELVTAEAQARSTEGQMRSLRFNIERAI